MALGNRALFLDRDGTLNELVHYQDSGEWESPRCPRDLRLLPGVIDVLKSLQDSGWHLFLISNQPSAAKGKVDITALQEVAATFEMILTDAGVHFRQSYYCFHHPEGVIPALSGPCPCRKPSPFFLQEAARDFGVDLAEAWMVGDQDMDLRCGRAAGTRTILIPNTHSEAKRGTVEPDFQVASLAELLSLFSLLEHP